MFCAFSDRLLTFMQNPEIKPLFVSTTKDVLVFDGGWDTARGEKLLILKAVKTLQMESVRLKINELMTSVGEEILCVLEKQQSVDVCGVKLDVRVFVLERLSVAAEVMCNLFQREIETLHNRQLHTAGMSVTHTHTTPHYTLQVCLFPTPTTPNYTLQICLLHI